LTIFFALIRGFHFASAMTLFGAASFAVLVRWRLRGTTGLPRAVFGWSAAIALLTAAAGIALVAVQMTDVAGAWRDPAILRQVVFGTVFGRLALTRCALFVAILFAVRLRPALSDVAVSGLAAAALILLGWTSHAAAAVAADYTMLFALNDALHLLAGGFWIGGLVALIPSLVTTKDKTALVARLRLFSRWAAGAVALLILAGTANAIAILDFRGMRWSIDYLTWLAIKLVLAGIMVALALTNRFAVLPGLVRGEADAAETLPLTLGGELAAAALILLCVGFLGLTAPMAM
jgi:putative copper resistance protein D